VLDVHVPILAALLTAISTTGERICFTSVLFSSPQAAVGHHHAGGLKEVREEIFDLRSIVP